MIRRRSLLALALSFGSILPTAAVAQSPDDDWPKPDEAWQPPVWVGDVTFLGANALLGGLTAGILREIRGGSFTDGFATGALGGAVSYGGRRLAGQSFWGAGLLGREVSAIGSSVVRNAGEAQPALSRLTLRAGPVILDVRRGAGAGVRASVDGYTTMWLLAAIFDDRLRMDWNASLSAGAPVFDAPNHFPRYDGRQLLGMAPGGLVLLGKDARAVPDTDVFAHERIHVLQYDFAAELWGRPLETWLAGLIPGGATVVRFVQPGVTYPLIHGAVAGIFDTEWHDRPWEIEAAYIEHR
jgi:hypothetical protein